MIPLVNRIITKPQPGIQINLMHPLARGLAACWLINEKAGSKLTDISINKNNGTLTNMDPSTDWVGSLRGSVLDFDGSNDYVDVGTDVSITLNRDFTVSAWVKRSISSGIRNAIISHGKNEWYLRTGTDGATNELEVLDSNIAVILTGNTELDTKWHHCAFTISAGGTATVTLYLDGFNDGNTTTTNVFDNGSETCIIGADHNGVSPAEFFNGNISDVRIWNRELTPREIYSLFSEPFAMFRKPDIFRFGALGVAVTVNNAIIMGHNF